MEMFSLVKLWECSLIWDDTAEDSSSSFQCSPNQVLSALPIFLDLIQYAALFWGICLVLGSHESGADGIGWNVVYSSACFSNVLRSFSSKPFTYGIPTDGLVICGSLLCVADPCNVAPTCLISCIVRSDSGTNVHITVLKSLQQIKYILLSSALWVW